MIPLTDNELEAIKVYEGRSSQVLALLLLIVRISNVTNVLSAVKLYNEMLRKVREVRLPC